MFSNLGLLFAIGVAMGFARDDNGAAGLPAVVGFMVATEGGRVLIGVRRPPPQGSPAARSSSPPAAFNAKAMARLYVPIGMLSGLMPAGPTIASRQAPA